LDLCLNSRSDANIFYTATIQPRMNQQQLIDHCDYIYFISEVTPLDQHTNLVPVKVGATSVPQRRVRQLQTGNPRPLFLNKCMRVPKTKALLVEGYIHQLLDEKVRRIHNEWFLLNVTDVDVIVALVREHFALYEPESPEFATECGRCRFALDSRIAERHAEKCLK